jgi:tRNA threonylcarbamoyladenosine biosynthesis protein TsaB
MEGKQEEPLSGLLLGLDTCGAESTVALGRVQAGKLSIENEALLPARAAGTSLTTAMQSLLGDRQPQELAGIVVVRGPGSFTGMRIGLSAAKALAHALQIPLFGISRLELLASLHSTSLSGTAEVAEAAHTSAVALDAGRGRVYLRTGSAAEPDVAGTDAPEGLLLSADDLGAMLSEAEMAAMLVCEEKVHAMFPGARLVKPPTAAQALAYTLQRVSAANAADREADYEAGYKTGYETLDALYLWRPEEMLARPGQSV